MRSNQIAPTSPAAHGSGSLLLATGLTFVSFILVPDIEA